MTRSDPTRQEALLTAVLVVGGQRARATAALASLIDEAAVAPLRIVLADLGVSQPPLPGSEHAAVEVMDLLPDDYYASVRERAVRAATTPFVAFIEEHCRALPGWANAVIEALSEGWDAVSYEMHNANPGEGSSDQTHFLTYGRQAPPAARREVALLPGTNSAFRREVLLDFGDDLGSLFRADPAIGHFMRARGRRCMLEPEAKVAHLCERGLSSLAYASFHFARAAAPVRAQVARWSTARRLRHIVGATGLPAYRAMRLGWFALTREPPMVRLYLSSLWGLVLVGTAAALGHALGLAFGDGGAARRFSRYELNAPRSEGDDWDVAWR